MESVRIYGTLGPACMDRDVLSNMFREGMDGIRLNLSHMTLEDASGIISSVMSAAGECGVRPELLIDMQGPELRTGICREPAVLSEGDLLEPGDIMLPPAAEEVLRGRGAGQEILIDDGKILLITEAADDGAGIRFRVLRGGVLRSRKSVALPGCRIEMPAMTEYDREQIRIAERYGVTAVMQPFVRSRDDLTAVRAALDEADGRDIRLLAKIENMSGVDRLEELIPCCDGIVIARGDLGNAMELWELPAVQKSISSACRAAGREFMVVTQMLDSMTHSPVPTRAEVSDIFNAVLDGASAVMVTGETAAGEYPALAVRYLSRTVREAERYLTDTAHLHPGCSLSCNA